MNESPSATNRSRFPTFRRFFGWLFSRRTLGRICVGVAALVTLVALVCTEESWRGKRAWQSYKRQLEAQGEKLDWHDYVSPPVPDDQNFTMTPFLAPMFDFNPSPRLEGQSLWRDTNGYSRITALQNSIGRLEDEAADHDQPRSVQRMTDLPGWAAALAGSTNEAAAMAAHALTRAEAAGAVLRGLAKYDAVVEELRTASRRPYARFNIHYDTGIATAILLPHLAFLKRSVGLFQVRASAELVQDHTDEAWADIKMALYLADTLNDEPFLISKLVQTSLVRIGLRPIWEGLAEHKWSNTQLVEIEERLGRINLLADAAMRGERAFDILVVNQLRDQGIVDPGDSHSRIPAVLRPFLGGFYYQNELFLTRLYQQYAVPVVDAAHQRVYPARAVGSDAAVANATAGGFWPYHILSRLLMPATAEVQTKFGFGQTRVNEAIVACALERYRLTQGQFPESLEPLSPRFLPQMPHDIITGAPLLYRRTTNGQFILYSVGWNEKDDGGTEVVSHPESSRADLTEGDWVWRYSAPATPPGQTAVRK